MTRPVVRQECVLGGDEFPIENYALVNSVLKAENPQPAFYLNPSVNLLLILQSEIRSDHKTHFQFSKICMKFERTLS